MMLHAREGLDRRLWLACGGRSTLASYGIPAETDGDYPQIPESHWRFLEVECRDYYETDTHFFVHANAYPDLDLDEQPGYMLRWESIDQRNSAPHCSGKVVVCGHTQQRSGLPLNLGHAVCIDTAAYLNGWLTCPLSARAP